MKKVELAGAPAHMPVSSSSASATPQPRPDAAAPPAASALAWPGHLLVLALYSLLTLFFCWPLLGHLDRTTPGQFPLDRNQYLWSFWWFKHALFDLGVNPFQTDLLYYPYGTTLFLHAFSPLNALLSLPLQFAFGLKAAYSLVGLLAFPLAAYTAFLLARYLCGQTWAAFCAGLIYSFTPFHYTELLDEHLYLVSTQWVPLYILFFLKAVRATERRPAIRYVLLAGLTLALTGFNDWYYLTYLGLFTIGYWLWHTARRWWAARAGRATWRQTLSYLRPLTLKIVAMWLLAGLGLSYLLFNLLRDMSSGRFETVTVSGRELDGSAFLPGPLLPNAFHPWWGRGWDFWQKLGIPLTESGTVTFSGLALLVLALRWRPRQALGWSLAALGWLLLALGPSLRWGYTNTGLPLPHRLLSELPFFNIGRYPERYMLMVNLSLAVTAAYALAVLFGRLDRHRLRQGLAVALVAALIYFEGWVGPLAVPPPIGPFPFADYVRASNGRVEPSKALLELPVTKHWTSDSARMLYQIEHQRPILGGYVSRKLVDLYRFGPPAPYPLYDFMDVRGFEPDIVPPRTGQQWLGLLNWGGIGYVVTYPAEFESRAQQQQTGRLLQAVFGPDARPDFQDATAQVWTVPPGGRIERPLLVLGWGWYGQEPAGASRVQRWINLDQKGEAQVMIIATPDTPLQPSYTLEIEAAPYLQARHLDVLLNGQPAGRLKIEGLQTFRLEGLKLNPGQNLLTLRPDPAEGFGVPAQQDPARAGQDQRRLTLTVLSLKLL